MFIDRSLGRNYSYLPVCDDDGRCGALLLLLFSPVSVRVNYIPVEVTFLSYSVHSFLQDLSYLSISGPLDIVPGGRGGRTCALVTKSHAFPLLTQLCYFRKLLACHKKIGSHDKKLSILDFKCL